jgi:TonB family protein
VTRAAPRDPSRDRLLSSVLLAVLLHALAFVALELFLKLAPQRTPEYRGPLFVQLEEQPVVRQARQAAPASAIAPSTAAAGQQGAAAAVPRAEPTPQLPSGPPLRAGGDAASARAAPGAAAPTPTGSPFRMEGAPAQQGRPQPAGQGFQVPSTEPTLPPAGTQAQGPALRAVAPGSGGQAAPAVPMDEVDRALASGSAARAAGGSGTGAPGTAGASGGAQSGAGQGDTSQEGFSIVLPDSVRGREVMFMPRIIVPKWVSEAGDRLAGDVSFELTPQGVLLNVKTARSSGHSDVDTVVLDAVRRMKFQPGGKDSVNVRGTVSYVIVPGSQSR